MNSDSTADTLKHIRRVNDILIGVAKELLTRAQLHDESKLHEPEKSAFDQATKQLKTLTYGSEEYRQALRELSPALQHHYACNKHHPEHWENGVDDMTLIDIVEMFCDWKAACERHDDGDLVKSIELNTPRFNLSEQMKQVFLNTAKALSVERLVATDTI